MREMNTIAMYFAQPKKPKLKPNYYHILYTAHSLPTECGGGGPGGGGGATGSGGGPGGRGGVICATVSVEKTKIE